MDTKKKRTFLSGAATVLATLLSTQAGAVAIKHESDQSASSDFIIQPAATAPAEALGHYSHTSHASHESHASHSSHSSHSSHHSYAS